MGAEGDTIKEVQHAQHRAPGIASGICYAHFSTMMRKSKAELRIVSLAPSATSILCAIGARKILVGVTKWCADVAPIGKVPKLGDCWYMGDVREIVELRPSLVIGSVPYQKETVAKLLEQPLTFLAMNPRTLADIENDIRMLGNVAERAKAASRFIRRMRTEFAVIARRTRTTKTRWRVYCEAWPNPRISSPPWVAELVRIAGGEMVLPAGQRVSDEDVAKAAPEIIVLAWAATGKKADPEKGYAVKAWNNIPAIVERQVHVVRDELLNTPGPPLLKGARELERIFTFPKTSQRVRR
jgi:iron complex transport system substrate-binding protein